MPESLFNKVAGFRPFFIKHIWWLAAPIVFVLKQGLEFNPRVEITTL